MYSAKAHRTHAYLRALLIVMPGVAEHQPHVVHHGLFRRVLLDFDVVLDCFQVHRLQNDFVVVGVVLLGRFDHKQLTEASIGAGLPSFNHCGVQRFHSVLLDVFLVAWKKKKEMHG